jgi:hypothetical protein
METASNRVTVVAYKNQRGPGWIVAHEVDEAGNILCVFIRVVPGGPTHRWWSDRAGQPTEPAPG